MKITLAILIAVILVASWVLWVRPWLRNKEWARGFFDLIEPIERRLWLKSETILWGRFLQGLGVVLAALTQLGEIDLTPLLLFVPEQYREQARAFLALVPMVVTLAGLMTSRLRKDTTKPLEVVALSPSADPDVKAAAAQAEAAIAAAVDVARVPS